ncbi:MAG: hypothetical protein QM773_15490 [Hyphomonadaceae bacterium]
MAYVFSVFRLSRRIRQLKRAGRALDAPDLGFGIDPARPFEVFRSLAWLMKGRYAKLGDEPAARWAGIARILFFVAAPLVVAMIVAVWAIVLSGMPVG